jgi:hypothetical protein
MAMKDFREWQHGKEEIKTGDSTPPVLIYKGVFNLR